MNKDTIITTLDIWSTSQTLKTSNRGRGASNQSLYGITKLRELILELAVRGKLVPQNPEDEPASVLLKRIEAEKKRLIKEGKIKKQDPLPEIEENEKPFELPMNWKWTKLQEISSYIQRGKGPKYSEKGNVRVISQKCIQWSGFDLSFSKFIEDSSINDYHSERFLQSSDLLWNSTGTGTVGRINVLTNIKTNTLVADSHVTVIRTLKIDSRYLGIYLTSSGIQQRIEPSHENSLVSGTTNQVELNTSSILPILIPIPPLPEQHRIVAKVDELMALCDRLEQKQGDSNSAHEILVETLLDTLTNAKDQSDFESSWRRIATHFDTLFTTEHSIDRLKQTILQLAVMGKLVPQNPKDEPASELLKKIGKEKAKLVKEGKIKKQNPLPEIGEDEKPFDIPKNWIWEKVGNTSFLKGGFAYQSTLFSGPSEYQVIRMGNIRPDYLRLDEHPAFIQQLLADETSEYQIELNDILLTMTGTKGKRDYLYSLIISTDHLKGRKLFLNQRLCIVRTLIYPEFLNMVMKDDRLLDPVYAKSTGTANQANIGMSGINEWVIPVPPLAEQHRIVAKVEELFVLCDGLKDRINQAQVTQLNLAKALVEGAVG